ncbi:neuropeptides capa receptor-like [Leptopilina boulardi]|uniref:neuropeptides capa receptor-like n=1 Tax=Leptopilina boulardi TaxID=63433 RepID=UPI0021F5A339|nr:neuropeptides capa receptor-like [Leptopilina boulardi]
MNYSDLLENKNNIKYELSIIPASQIGLGELDLENVTDKYLFFVNLKEKLQDSLVDHVFFDVAAPLSFLYLLVLILGVIGNVTTCIVIIKSPSLRNATNYYLFSLAISDLMLLIIGMILDFRILWKKYPWIWGLALCKVLHYLYSVAYNVSVLTVLAFSFERYLAICHPLRINNLNVLKRPIWFIIILWIIASIFSSNQLFRQLTKYVFQLSSGLIIDPEKLIACELTDSIKWLVHDHLNFIFFFVLPMMVIVILYIKIERKLQDSCQGKTLNYGKSCSSIRQLQSRQSSIKMLRVVVIVTFICWAPNNLIFLFEQIGKIQTLDYDLYHWVMFLSNLFFYASTVVNPIIYNLMSSRYREAFKNIFHGKEELSSKMKIKVECNTESSV